MRLFLILTLVLALLSFAGCKKKQDTLSESQVPLSIEMIPTSNITNMPNLGANVTLPEIPVNESMPSASSQSALKEVSLPQGPYKPTSQEIQTALKNAGYYAGEIDGKIGPKSKKAIEDFQKASNLKADGKVGPKTWAALSAYLNPSAPEAPEAKRQ